MQVLFVSLLRLPFFHVQVAGTSGKALLEGGSDDEGSSTEAHGRAIIEVLGRDKRNEILAALYMVRTDVSLSVRQVVAHFHLSFSLACHLLFMCFMHICKLNVPVPLFRLPYMYGKQ